MVRSLVVLAAVFSMASVSGPALASGSYSGGGGGAGGYGGGGFGSGSGSGSSAPRVSPEEALLNRGRSQVRKRITCKKCEYHDNLNQQTAGEIAEGVRNGKFDIKDRNRNAVLFFLRQRYGV